MKPTTQNDQEPKHLESQDPPFDSGGCPGRLLTWAARLDICLCLRCGIARGIASAHICENRTAPSPLSQPFPSKTPIHTIAFPQQLPATHSHDTQSTPFANSFLILLIMNRNYSVFLSHAGPDKESIAIPLLLVFYSYINNAFLISFNY